MHQPHDRSSKNELNSYQFKGPLKLNDPYGVGSDKDKEYSHHVEINGPPVILQDHIRVSGHEDYQVHLLSLVGHSDYILGSQDF